MSNEESMAAAAVKSRRVPRQGVGGAPVGSTLSIVLAVVAVVAGFLILRNINESSSQAAGADGIPEGAIAGGITTIPGDDAAPEPTTPTTEPPPTTIARITEGATVAVANVNNVGGSAGDMTKSLDLEGYTMGSAVNGSGPDIEDTIVYYDETNAAARDVADSVARDLGGVSVLPVPTPVPTDSGSLDDAGVLVMLGNNEAGKSVAELTEAAEEAAEPEAAPAPEVSGGDDDTTSGEGDPDDATDGDDGATDE